MENSVNTQSPGGPLDEDEDDEIGQGDMASVIRDLLELNRRRLEALKAP